MKAAIYARVSTEKQGRDQTVDSQLDALRRWATAHGHELKDDHVYIDEGYSGARLDRPALDRLRDAAREGEFDVLGVYSPDRLARRYAYQVLLLEEFRKAACDVEFIERPISDDPHDQLLLQIQGAIAEYERAVLAERFRRGKLQKARAGQWGAGQGPYGYRYVPKRDGVPGHLEIDEAEAAVVRMLYRWLIDERMTVRQIIKRLAAGPVAAPQRQAALVQRRRAPDPLRPALHRHGLRQPVRARGPAQAPVRRPPGGPADLPQAAPARGVDPHPGAGHHRRHDVSRCERTTRPQLGPVLPQQHPQRLPAPLPAHLPDVRPGHVRRHQQRGRRAASASLLHMPRQGHAGTGPGVSLSRSLGPGSRSSTRPSGTTSSGCSTTRPRWPPSSRSGPSRPTRSTPTPMRRARSGRPSCAGSTVRSSGCSTPTRPRRSTLMNSRDAVNRSGFADRFSRCNATRSNGCAASVRRRRRSGPT